MTQRPRSELVAAAAFALAGAAPPPAITLDGVPAIAEAIEASTLPYQDYRTARFQDWDPAGGMLVLTRFGDTPQIHRVAMPGGDRSQISFRAEPVAAAGILRGPRPILIAAQDSGGGEKLQI